MKCMELATSLEVIHRLPMHHWSGHHDCAAPTISVVAALEQLPLWLTGPLVLVLSRIISAA